MAAHELMSTEDHYEAKRNSDDDLDDTLEAAWDSGQALEDEKDISRNFVKGEIDRRGSSEAEIWEGAFDSAVMTKEAAQARHAAAAGNATVRPPAKVTKKAADSAAYQKYLEGEWDKRTPGTARAAEARPAESMSEAAAPQQTTAAGLTEADHAALAQAPPETRAVIDRHLAAHRETYGGIDALADRWGGALASRGVGTPGDQVQHLDGLLETEHTLATGSPAEKIAVMQRIAQHYGVGAPSGGPAPQPQPQAQMQPPPQPQPTGDPLVDQLQQTHAEQQAAAWHEAMATAGPQGEQAQKVHHAEQHIMQVASAKNQDGTPAFPYFGDVGKEIYSVIQGQMANGQRPDLVGAYHAAVNMRPDIQAHRAAQQHRKLRVYKEQNPIMFDPVFAKRAKSIAAGHIRTGTPTSPDAILAETARREPGIAAKYRRQVETAKAHWPSKIEPSIGSNSLRRYVAGSGVGQ